MIDTLNSSLRTSVSEGIHPSAIIHPTARIASDVEIGPWTVIGPNVEIDSGTWIASHVVIRRNTRMGKNNKVFQFASLGEDTPDKKYHGEETWLEIGDDNIFREYCSVHRGTEQGGGFTRIGNGNLFMACTHVAHDCVVGHECILANYAALAGHVTLEDYVGLGGYAGIHQFCRVGAYSFVAMSTPVTQDIVPYVMVSGHTPKLYGLNQVGLKRRGFSDEQINAIKKAYNTLFRKGLTLKDAVAVLESSVSAHPEYKRLIDFLNQPSRGLVR